MFSQGSVSHSVHRGWWIYLVPCPFQEDSISGSKSLPGIWVCLEGKYVQKVGYVQGVNMFGGGYVEGVPTPWTWDEKG